MSKKYLEWYKYADHLQFRHKRACDMAIFVVPLCERE